MAVAAPELIVYFPRTLRDSCFRAEGANGMQYCRKGISASFEEENRGLQVKSPRDVFGFLGGGLLCTRCFVL